MTRAMSNSCVLGMHHICGGGFTGGRCECECHMPEEPYGVSETQTKDSDTLAHILRSDGRSICGVKISMTLETLVGWNLCQRCEAIQEGK